MPIRAYVFMNTNPATAREAAEAVSKIDGVMSTDVTTGRFDIVAVVDSDRLDLSSLENLIMTVRRVPGVIKTETAISTSKFVHH